MKLVKDVNGNSHPEDIRNQMSLISDTDEILKFLEMAGKKSILNEHTVTCRLTACHNLFSILNSGEDNVHYMLQNLDLLINRFRNKNSNVQASTLKVYKSRLKGTLEDFVAFSKDSVTWERSVLEKAKNNNSQRDKKTKQATAPAEKPATRATRQQPQTPPVETSSRVSENAGSRKVSFPLRPDFNLEVSIPVDGLSSKELIKLSLFLFPYCKDMDTREEPVWTGALLPQ